MRNMIRFLSVLFFCLLTGVASTAQNAKVLSFALDAADLAAQQRNVKDLNGDTVCLGKSSNC